MAELTPHQKAKQAATEVFFANGLLTRETHQRLIDNIDSVLRVANVASDYLYAPMSKVCGPEEIDWVCKFRGPSYKQVAGMVYSGKVKDLEERMKTIVGVFLRNYVDARFATVQSLIEDLKHGDLAACSVLVVPNFYLGHGKGGVQDWQMQNLYDMLLNRHSAGLKTVLYAKSLSELRGDHGDLLTDHLENYYLGVTS